MDNKKNVWYIECRTGCSCCSDENFYQGFYYSEEEVNAVVSAYRRGEGNPLASQYARNGNYSISKAEAEILPDGRLIVEGSVYSEGYVGHLH